MKRHIFVLLLAAGLSGSLSGCVGLLLAGAAGSVFLATDRRTTGAYLDDQSIELKAADQMSTLLPSAHVNATSFNRTVLLTGEVPSHQARQRAEITVRSIPSVQRVYNHTAVGPVSGFAERSIDTWVTSKVRARLLSGEGYNPRSIKVVTERGVVYMLGIVTRVEGEVAASVVSETAGVKKVITLFEYINDIVE